MRQGFIMTNNDECESERAKSFCFPFEQHFALIATSNYDVW